MDVSIVATSVSGTNTHTNVNAALKPREHTKHRRHQERIVAAQPRCTSNWRDEAGISVRLLTEHLDVSGRVEAMQEIRCTIARAFQPNAPDQMFAATTSPSKAVPDDGRDPRTTIPTSVLKTQLQRHHQQWRLMPLHARMHETNNRDATSQHRWLRRQRQPHEHHQRHMHPKFASGDVFQFSRLHVIVT